MKNFIGVGNRVTLTAAAVTTSGQPVLIGSLFGIAENAAATWVLLTQEKLGHASPWKIMPSSAATGLIVPGQFVRYMGDKPAMGIVRSTSLNWSFPKLRQSIVLETHA